MTTAELPGVGVFGTGSLPRSLVPLLRREGFRVEAIWGQTSDEAESAAKDLNIPFATSRVDEVLLRKDVDLVVILCPPSHHSQISVKALGIGKHVVVQCPAGLSQEESLRMVQAAAYYPRLTASLASGLRFLPCFAKMRRAVEAGSIIGRRVDLADVRVDAASLVGKRYSWRCDTASGGGALSLLGAHVVDLLLFLTGQRARRVSGCVRALTLSTAHVNGIREIGADDVAFFQVELDGGCFAAVTINTHLGGGGDREKQSSFRQEVSLSGPEGILVARNGKLFCRRKNEDNWTKEEPLLIDDDDCTDSDDDPLSSGIHLRGMGLLFRHLAKSFSSCDGSNEENFPKLTTFEEGWYVQATLEAVRRSSRDRCWTQVNIMLEPDNPDGKKPLLLLPPHKIT